MPQLGEMTARMDPADVLIWALVPQKALSGRAPSDVFRSGDATAIAQLMEMVGRLGLFGREPDLVAL